MVMSIREWIEKLKDKWSSVGFTCDVCGREVFDYPSPRICSDCQKALLKNEGTVCERCGRATVTEGICTVCKAEMPAFDKGISAYVYHGEAAGVGFSGIKPPFQIRQQTFFLLPEHRRAQLVAHGPVIYNGQESFHLGDTTLEILLPGDMVGSQQFFFKVLISFLSTNFFVF